jgi:hypothetical protein
MPRDRNFPRTVGPIFWKITMCTVDLGPFSTALHPTIIYTKTSALLVSSQGERHSLPRPWRCGAPGWGPPSTTTRRGFETRGALRNKENRLAGFFPLAYWRVVSFASRRSESFFLLLVWG